jgi:hypothetical protein
MPTTHARTSDTSNAIDLTAIEAELRPLATDKLKSLFLECYGKAGDFLARAAICVKLMEERGENLKGFPMLGLFRRIAAGQVIPELVWTFIESPSRTIVERCALPDQKRLVANPMVPVIEPTADGKSFTTRMVDMRTAHVSVAKQAIGPDGIRTPEEQIIHITTQKSRPALPSVDDKANEIREPLDHSIMVRLTASEMEALKIRAALAHASEREIARRYLLQTDVLKRPKT